MKFEKPDREALLKMCQKLMRISGLFFSMFIVFGHTSVTYGQTLTPQKVIAEYKGELPAGLWNKSCPAVPIEYHVEVWNVGAEGGPDYAEGTFTQTMPKGHCKVENGIATLSEPQTGTITGTFSG